jgi:hypothetical protein
MHELALSFKGRPLSVHPVLGERMIVGRDPGCDLVIDSLAVAPQHLALQSVDGRVVLVALTAAYPVLRNGRRVSHAVLEEGDRILVGKHTLSLSLREGEADQTPRTNMGTSQASPAPAPQQGVGAIEAYLQIQSGRHIGAILTLTRAVTRLRRIGGTEVIVSRRDSGYVLSRLGGANRVYVGRAQVSDDREIPLTHGTPIEIDGIRCQFFLTLASSAA